MRWRVLSDRCGYADNCSPGWILFFWEWWSRMERHFWKKENRLLVWVLPLISSLQISSMCIFMSWAGCPHVCGWPIMHCDQTSGASQFSCRSYVIACTVITWCIFMLCASEMFKTGCSLWSRVCVIKKYQRSSLYMWKNISDLLKWIFSHIRITYKSEWRYIWVSHASVVSFSITHEIISHFSIL